MAYLPIELYGLIGDLHSAALVGANGSIDWCCLPYFDSPSVFGRILDDQIGGHFQVAPSHLTKNRQMYLPDSNILVTRSYTETGLGELEDFMPIPEGKNDASKVHQIHRIIKCIRGEVTYNIECFPAFDYARKSHVVHQSPEGAVFETEGLHTYVLRSDVPLQIRANGAAGSITLREGERASLTFACFPSQLSQSPFPMLGNPDIQLEQTIRYWQHWISKCTYKGRWSEMVYRSALVLKLLTFAPTGAIVAAPTMSLPEGIGGTRNWDYRYTWIRDASFTIYALMRIGYQEEATAFLSWLEARCDEMNTVSRGKFNPFSWFGGGSTGETLHSSVPPLNLMYGIRGEHVLPEFELDHLKGYRDSRPVRVGNGAYSQLQLDIYGELLDAVYIYNRHVKPISAKFWSNIRQLIEWVQSNWDREDEGIWEWRAGRRNFVFSRLMNWVALDRAVRLSFNHGYPGNTMSWIQTRDRIYDQIMDKGWNEERQAFRQCYENSAMDSANLMMPLVKFIAAGDPRMLSTIDATVKILTRDYLVYRYDPEVSQDGITGEEGTFSICTFWLAECLARAGRVDEAHLMLQRIFSAANHLGLYSEEMGLNGEMLGNFPQAYTHLSLISAAVNVDRALEQAKRQQSGVH